MKTPLLRWPPDVVARAPLSIYAKLLAAFLAISCLLIIIGAVSLAELSRVNRSAEEQVKLQRKIAAYRQLQHGTTAQLYSVASALVVPDERTLDATLRQLNQFGYDLDRLQFVTQDEAEIVGRVRKDYEAFITVVTEVVELVRAGKVAQGREAQIGRAGPLADRLERLTNELVNKAEADMLARVDENQQSYLESRRLVIALAVGSLLLALGLGYSISWSIIGPVRKMDQRFSEIAAGDFSARVQVPNRDEFGALAGNLNRMSAELERLYGQLEAASRRKSEFLANMSHELRTPLNAVIGFSEVLEERMFGELNEKQAEYVQDIHSSGEHLLSLINEILDLSKIEAGRMELELTEFSLRAMLEGANTLVRERAARHSIALSLEIETGLDMVRGDERKLKQVMLNLLSNAVKFTPDAGAIRVIARSAEGAIEVSVSDSGVGISPQDQALVFEEFRQVGGDSARKAEGTGLGLALAKKFVELHGGTMRLESALGRGSTFTFTLPRRES
ncbi:MAG: HAMP domain-containing protein [Betaproteobacteria bacterium]|nr:HAMP domain-containing protein [Betaproteobacteria bacterium]